MQNETMGQLLPFAQSAQTLKRFAGKHSAQGNDLQALELLRRSFVQEPDNDETALALAEAYASMQCYSLSNRLLIPRITSPEVGEQCLFGAACNMMSLGMADCARDLAVMYLHDYPDGEWAPDAVELIEDCETAQDGDAAALKRAEKRLERALPALDADRPALAVRLIGRALAVSGRNSAAKSLLAFALVAEGDAKAAVQAARQALHDDKSDVRAICAMAASLYTLGSKNTARGFLEKAAAAAQTEDEAMLVCHTACEMDAPDVMLRVLRETEEDAPYSDELLHLLACAAYNDGQRERAVRSWKLIRRINPMDAVAEYRLRQAESDAPPEKMPYNCRLPLEETLRRLGMLRQMVEEGVETLQARLDGEMPDDGLEALVRWALESDEAGVAKAAVRVLLALRGEKAKSLLLGVLSDLSAEDGLKHEALAALCVMDVQGPFYVVVGGRMSIVQVSRVPQKTREAHGKAFFAAAKRRVKAADENEIRLLRALCDASARRSELASTPVRMKTVALAYRMMTGGGVSLSEKEPQRRRLERIARQLAREVTGNGMHQF